MASTHKTRLRLQQVTGSAVDIKTEAIQYASPQTAAALTGSDALDMLGALAAAVHRIHGKGSTEIFQNSAGVFYHGLTIESANGLLVGAGGNEFSISESSDDVTLKTLISNKDMIFNVNDGGSDTEVFRLDGDVSSLLVAGTKKLTFNDAGTLLHSPADGKLLLQADGAAADAIVIDASGNAGIDITVGNAANDANASLDIVAMNKVTIDAQGTDAGDGVEITLGTDTANAKFMILNNSESPQFTVDGAGTTTIAGDLVVQGATTTVSSSNTVFQDSILGLGVSGSLNEDWNNLGDRAIIFARAAETYSFLPALNFDGTGFVLGTFSASPSSSSMGAAQAGSELRTGHLKPISDDGATLGDANERWSDLFLAEGAVINFDNGDFTMTQTNNLLALAGGNTRVDKLEVDGASDHIDVAGSNLTATAGQDFIVDAARNIILDADSKSIELKDNGATRGVIVLETDLTISSSAGAELVLDANGSKVKFASKGFTFGTAEDVAGSFVLSSSEGNGLILASNDKTIQFFGGEAAAGFEALDIELGTAGKAKFKVGDAGGTTERLSLATNGLNELSGSLALDAGAAQSFISFAETNANGSGVVKLQGPAAVNGNDTITFTLPAADGVDGQLLKTDGSGILSFTDAVTVDSLSRRQIALIAPVASGTTLDPNGSVCSNTSPYSKTALDFSAINAANATNVIDVYVNGQLLVSGSNANVGTGAADYCFSPLSNVAKLDFAFDLEIDDIVVINRKA